MTAYPAQSRKMGIGVVRHHVYIPTSIKSISKSPTPEKWTLALNDEIASLISQNFFDLTPVDISTIDLKLIIPSRVLFDTRLNGDGSINKYKAEIQIIIKPFKEN
jgi:hypothetical protein